MSEYTELTAKIEALEKRVKYLEDTFATLADMNKSGEMAQYIAQRQRALVASKLVNAAAGTQKLNADVQQQVLDQLAAEKAAMDARIEEAIRASEQNAPAEDDLAEQFTYREVPGGVEIQGFNGFETGDELLLPQKINGKPVVGIGKEAFAKMTFKKVILPEEIHYIGINAFWECKQLAVANLPESLKELCFGCFSGTGLRQIKIPSKCKEIPEKCFKDCKQLQTVVLNDGLERIKREAFNDSGLCNIIIPDSMKKIEMAVFDYHDFRNAKDLNIAILGKDTEFELMPFRPSSCTTIYCLAGSKVQNQARLKGIPVKPLSAFKNA